MAVASGNDFYIHSINPSLDTDISPIHHDLTGIFFKHRKLTSRAGYKPKISTSIIQWEYLNSVKSSKVAICASDGILHLVLIFSLDGEHPVVIEADFYGVERLQWLSLYPEVISAYSNCTFLAVFTKFGLELRVYSLTHTHMLFSVPKPLINEMFIRPGDSGVFSVITSPYQEKNALQKDILDDPTALWPSLLQFYSRDGLPCSLLASLKLDFDPSPQAQFSWSLSGKWLMYFDTYHSLNAPKLSVFNILGIHDQPIEDAAQHVAQPTRKLDFKPESDEAHIFGLRPSFMWGHLQSVDYILVVPTSTKEILHIRVSDLYNMYKSEIIELDLNAGPIWRLLIYSANEHRYKRSNHLPNLSALNWSKTISFGSSHLVATDNCTVIFKSLFSDQLNFKITAVIFSSLALLETKELSNGSHILAFTDHIALLTPAGLDVIYSSATKYSQVKFVEEEDELKISIVETSTSTSGMKWTQISHNLKNRKTTSLTLNSAENGTQDDETNLKRSIFNYTKGAGKVERFLHKVHTGVSSDSSGLAEEITDTFQAQKRRRK